MIAILIIVYVALVLVLFKVLRLKPTAYLIAGLIVAGVFMIGGVVVVWTQSAPITDKMVTSQYVVQLVPYVKGQVKVIHAEANQRVKKGDLLLEIDPAPYKYTVNQVEAQLAASKANVRQAEAALATAKTAIPNAQASLLKAKAADELAKTQEQIALNIQRADKAAISQLNVAKATQERQEAEAAVQQAEAALAQAEASAQQAEAVVQTAQSNVPAVEAQLDDARFNLAQCKMTAPGDGYVTNWQVQIGTMLVPMPLAAAGTFVNVSDTAVAAVFPQNWLSNVEPGDDVDNGAQPLSGPPVPWKSGLRDSSNWGRSIHNQRHNTERSADRIRRALCSADQFQRRCHSPQAVAWVRRISGDLYAEGQGHARHFEGHDPDEEVAAVRHALSGKAAVLTCNTTTKRYTRVWPTRGERKSWRLSIRQRLGGRTMPALLLAGQFMGCLWLRFSCQP
ncbi:multidrug resistance efflux pump [Bradyrhizobium sp. LB7.2]